MCKPGDLSLSLQTKYIAHTVIYSCNLSMPTAREEAGGKDVSGESEGTSKLRETSKENPVRHRKAVWREVVWWALGGT